MTNPLLSEWNGELLLPPFKNIEDIHFEDAIQKAMDIQNSEIKEICNQRNPPSFSNTIIQFINSGKKLIDILSIFYSLCAKPSSC